jgi:hypothetical protein
MWTHIRPAASMDSTLASSLMQAQHICEHGAGNPWPSQASMSAPQWGQLDPFMQDVRDAGAVEKMVVFNKAPRWMVADPAGADDQRPTTANFGNFATISAQAAARYTDFQWGTVWNEYKGFWNNALNRPDYELYLTFYNQVRNAVKAVRPTMKVGGPYTTQISSSYQRGETTTTAAFPGGYFDNRWFAAMTHFIQNAQYDFLCFDMGVENSFNNFGGAYFGANPQLQIQKFANFIGWIRGHGGAAATVPIVGTETYVHMAALAPGGSGGGGYGYSAGQLEDLYIELCRQTQAASPNGPLYWMPWGHPNFWPQVVTRSADTQSWTNTTSAFKAKVDTWHTTGV